MMTGGAAMGQQMKAFAAVQITLQGGLHAVRIEAKSGMASSRGSFHMRATVASSPVRAALRSSVQRPAEGNGVLQHGELGKVGSASANSGSHASESASSSPACVASQVARRRRKAAARTQMLPEGQERAPVQTGEGHALEREGALLLRRRKQGKGSGFIVRRRGEQSEGLFQRRQRAAGRGDGCGQRADVLSSRSRRPSVPQSRAASSIRPSRSAALTASARVMRSFRLGNCAWKRAKASGHGVNRPARASQAATRALSPWSVSVSASSAARMACAISSAAVRRWRGNLHARRKAHVRDARIPHGRMGEVGRLPQAQQFRFVAGRIRRFRAEGVHAREQGTGEGDPCAEGGVQFQFRSLMAAPGTGEVQQRGIAPLRETTQAGCGGWRQTSVRRCACEAERVRGTGPFSFTCRSPLGGDGLEERLRHRPAGRHESVQREAKLLQCFALGGKLDIDFARSPATKVRHWFAGDLGLRQFRRRLPKGTDNVRVGTGPGCGLDEVPQLSGDTPQVAEWSARPRKSAISSSRWPWISSASAIARSCPSASAAVSALSASTRFARILQAVPCSAGRWPGSPSAPAHGCARHPARPARRSVIGALLGGGSLDAPGPHPRWPVPARAGGPCAARWPHSLRQRQNLLRGGAQRHEVFLVMVAGAADGVAETGELRQHLSVISAFPPAPGWRADRSSTGHGAR